MKTVRLRLKKKIKTKLVALTMLTMAVLGFTAFGIYTFASKESQLLIEVTNKQESYSRGDEVEVKVKLDVETDVEYNSINFMLEYDHDALELLTDFDSAPDNSGWTVALCGEASTETKGISCGLQKATSYNSGSKDLATFRFKIKETDNVLGNISLSFNEENTAVEKIVQAGTDYSRELIETKKDPETIFVKVPVQSVTLATSDIEIDMNSGVKTSQIELNVNPTPNNDEREVTYSPANGDIVDVSTSGLITAKKVGETDININAYGTSLTAHVKVVAHIQGVSLNTDSHTINLNDSDKTYRLVATLDPEDVYPDSKTIEWDSSERSVATVDNGLVTAHAIGTTIITAKTSNNKTASATIKVIAPATSVDITDDDFTLTRNKEDNKTKQLNLTIEPNPTSDKTTWEVDNNGVVSVNESGLVTAIGVGQATITVHVGEQSDTVHVTVNAVVEDITLDVRADETISLYPTQKRPVNGVITPSDATTKTITWSIENSSTSDVAEVDANGLVTAKNPGTATLVAEADGIRVTRNIKVLTPVSSFVVDQPNITLNANNKQSIEVSTTILPDNTDVDKTVTWKSENANIASVVGLANGRATITAVAMGDTKITGTLEDGSTVTVEVHVIAPITGVTLNKNKVTLVGKDATEQLEAIISPNPTSDSTALTWESSADGIVTVENGMIKAVAKGHAIITVKTSNNLTAQCEVDVLIPAQKVTINEGESLDIEKGNGSTLTATVEPGLDEITDTLVWSSSNDDIVSVEQDGTILAKKAGTAKITAKAGNVSDTITVNVFVKINSFTLESDDEIEILRGNKALIVTQIGPEDATEDRTITWTSDDEDVAIVSEGGVVTGVGEGVANIKGKLKNGLEVNVQVTVIIIPIEDMKAKEEKLDLLKGAKGQLELIIEPEETTEKDLIKWTSSDDDIATVDENGLVTAKKEGKVTITATYEDLEVTFEVNVTEIHLEGIEIVSPSDELMVGEAMQLQFVLNPQDTTDDLTFTYKSSDEEIATVTQDGLVKAYKSGTVTITVTASNGMEKTFVLKVNAVEIPPTYDRISNDLALFSLSFVGCTTLGVVYFKKYRKIKKAS